MKTISLFVTFFIFFVSEGNTQIIKKVERAARRGAERTVERRIEKEATKKTDRVLDEVFEDKNKPANRSNRSATNRTAPGADNPQVTNSSPDAATDPELNFTGNTIFEDDFPTTRLGDFPAKFKSSTGGEVVQQGNSKGLKFYPNSNVILNLQTLPQNFALSFNLTLENVPSSLYRTAFNVFLQEQNVLKHNDPKNKYGAVGFSLWGDKKDHQIDLFNKKGAYEIKEKIPFDINGIIIDQTSTWILLRNGNRLRVFINGNKIADAPNLLDGIVVNHINMRLDGTKKEENHAFIISNVRVTEIGDDLRSQLIDKGNFSTSNILFASGSDKIQPSSFKLLNEIAALIRTNPATFSIVGHTDSDGDENTNQSLSLNRAESVKKYLVGKGVSAGTLQTAGKGESQPIAPNETAEGKARNRRVQFIKN